MAGDCPEARSSGSASISGVAQDNLGNPVAGVQIIIHKAKGVCPQSIEENANLVSDEHGNFSEDIYVHMGDPPINVRVLSEGYQPYEFRYDAAQYQFSIITLTVMVGEALDVQWSATGREQATLKARREMTSEALLTPSPVPERST